MRSFLVERLPTGSDAEPAPSVDTGTGDRNNQPMQFSALCGSRCLLFESVCQGDAGRREGGNPLCAFAVSFSTDYSTGPFIRNRNTGPG